VAPAPASTRHRGSYRYRAAISTAGEFGGGTIAVTITGTGFVSGATITIGGVAATSVVLSPAFHYRGNQHTCSAWIINVVVTNPDTQSGTGTASHYQQAVPTVTAISPTAGNSGGGGTAVTITGTGFVSRSDNYHWRELSTSVVFLYLQHFTTAVTQHYAAGLVNAVVTNRYSKRHRHRPLHATSGSYRYRHLQPAHLAVALQ
jgi:hypothetical protein